MRQEPPGGSKVVTVEEVNPANHVHTSTPTFCVYADDMLISCSHLELSQILFPHFKTSSLYLSYQLNQVLGTESLPPSIKSELLHESPELAQAQLLTHASESAHEMLEYQSDERRLGSEEQRQLRPTLDEYEEDNINIHNAKRARLSEAQVKTESPACHATTPRRS
jgi:hypothetical protein